MISNEEEFEKLLDVTKNVIVYSGDVPLPTQVVKKIKDDSRFKFVECKGDFLNVVKTEMEVEGNFLMAYVNAEPYDVVEIDPKSVEFDVEFFLKSIKIKN